MPFYGKRRKPSGPNKNEQKVMRAESDARKAGSKLAQRFPTVESITITRTFVGPQGQTLEESKKTFKSGDAPDFSASCPGRCGGGKFNLDAKVESVVENRQPVAEATGLCQEPLYAGSSDFCGTKLQTKIEVSYLPEAEPEPAA